MFTIYVICVYIVVSIIFDVIFCYKIVFGLVHVNCDDSFTLATVTIIPVVMTIDSINPTAVVIYVENSSLIV